MRRWCWALVLSFVSASLAGCCVGAWMSGELLERLAAALLCTLLGWVLILLWLLCSAQPRRSCALLLVSWVLMIGWILAGAGA